MFYIVLVAILILIGTWDIRPLVEWIEEKSFHQLVQSGIMIGLLGVVPALIIGASIVGDTIWGRNRR